MSDRVDLLEFIGAFVVEAEEIVGSANAALLEIEVANGEGTVRPRAVRELFRALHTIKGLAGMVGVEPIVEIAHALEGLVRIADRTGGSLGRAAVEVSLQAVHAISERVRAVSDHRPVLPAPARLLEAIAATDAAGDAPSAALPISGEWKDRLTPSESQQLAQALHGEVPVWTFSFTPSPGNAARGITITSVRAGLAAIGEVVKVRPRAIELPDQAAGVTFDILVITPADRDAIARIAATTPDQVSAVRPELDTQAGPITEVLDTIEAEHHVSSGAEPWCASSCRGSMTSRISCRS